MIRAQFVDQFGQKDSEESKKPFRKYGGNGQAGPSKTKQQSKSDEDKGSKSDKKKSSFTCFTCGESGHWARDCPEKGHKGKGPQKEKRQHQLVAAPKEDEDKEAQHALLLDQLEVMQKQLASLDYKETGSPKASGSKDKSQKKQNFH